MGFVLLLLAWPVFCLASLEYKLDARVRRKARRYKLGDGILKYLIIKHMHSFGELFHEL